MAFLEAILGFLKDNYDNFTVAAADPNDLDKT
jgi:hypothetical protein